MARSLKLNFVYNIFLQVSKVIFPLITAPYIARVLDPDGVGLFNFAYTYSSYFALIATLGIPTYGVREIAKLRGNTKAQEIFVSEMISIGLLTTLVCTLTYFLSIVLIPQLDENFWVFIISALVLYITPFKVEWYFQGNEEFGFITARSLVVKLLAVISLFLFVHQKDDLVIYVAINALCSIVNEFWNYLKMLRLGIRPHLIFSVKKHMKPLLLLFASSIAMSMYSVLDTLMLGFMSDYSNVGFYNSAIHLSKSLLPIVTGFATVAMPRLSYYVNQKDKDAIEDLIQKSIILVSFLCFPLAFALFAISPSFILLFYGENFADAVLPLQIIVWIIVAIGFNNLFGIQVLISLREDKLFLYSIIIGTLCNLILNIVLIPHYGACGAAIASVTAEMLIALSMLYMINYHTYVRIGGWKMALECLLVSVLYIPLFKLLSIYLSDWILIMVFTIIGGFYYILVMYILKNPAVYTILRLIKSKTNKQI